MVRTLEAGRLAAAAEVACAAEMVQPHGVNHGWGLHILVAARSPMRCRTTLGKQCCLGLATA